MSNTENISPTRISELRTRYGLSQDEFAVKLGVSRNYVSMLERGAKEVSADSSIGLLFQVLEEKAGIAPSREHLSSVVWEENSVHGNRMIPVIGWAHAGEAASYEQLPESWQQKIPTECRDEAAFAVNLEGDSMEPKFSDGDMLVLQPSVAPYSGCLVVARFVDDGVVFRRFETTGKVITLVPLNPRYETSQHTLEEFSWIYPVWGRWTQIWRR